ncbi:MAG TPA: hypothetical protein PLO34_07650 [Pseudoxanthomonas sp.]|nr:hypothetical protein [Pseudoxanthomonas sp.]
MDGRALGLARVDPAGRLSPQRLFRQDPGRAE